MSEENEINAAMDENALTKLAQDEAVNENDSENEQIQIEPEIPTAELINPIVSFAVNVAAPNWEVDQYEISILADAYAGILDKYFPNAANHFGVEFNALIMTAGIFAPRIGKPRFKEIPRPSGTDNGTEESPQEMTRPGQFDDFKEEVNE